MRKLRLDPENLQVETFTTLSDAATPRGTVHGRATAFTNCTCDYGACTGNYYTCDAKCTTAQTAQNENTCDLMCGGGGTGGNSMQTACLDCYSQAAGCTAFDGCHTVDETCYPCG